MIAGRLPGEIESECSEARDVETSAVYLTAQFTLAASIYRMHGSEVMAMSLLQICIESTTKKGNFGHPCFASVL